jgi:teichuronic acid exporter
MMLIIAALLSPTEYGIVSLCTIIVMVAQLTNEAGIWQAVVHRADPDRQFVNTAFVMNIIGGVVISVSFILAIPWIANFFGEPQMTAVLRVMGLALLADMLFYVPDGLLRKELRFKSRAVPEIAATFGAGVATIGLLLLGVGIMSYAIGYVVESVVRCALTFGQVSWRPKLQASWVQVREIASYAKPVLGSDLTRHSSSYVDYLIVGRILGAGQLGFYTLALSLSNYLVENFARILSRLAFPTFATLQGDVSYARRVYLKMIQLVAALVLPILTTLALLATPLIGELLGDRWQPAVVLLQIMVVAGISRAISFPSRDMLWGTGFPKIPFKVDVFEGVLIMVVLLLIAVQGIEVIAIAVTVIRSLTSWAIMLITCRMFGIGLRELGRVLVPGIALAVSGAATILTLELLVPDLLSGGLELIALTAAAGAAMIFCLLTVCRGFFREVVTLLRSRKPVSA